MTRIVGIVNCTPDSFSDGSGVVSSDSYIERAKSLLDEGADLIDLGGDSTRPRSICVGVEEEWRRVAPVLLAMASQIPCSVDTHHAEVARRAIEHGAAYINDISGMLSPEMLDCIASSGVNYVAMCNPNRGAHHFGHDLPYEAAFSTISSWMTGAITTMRAHGIPDNKIILDPGMGAFISSDPRVSWEIITRCHELPVATGGLFIGCSRKGFLAIPGEKSINERDKRTASIGKEISERMRSSTPLYLRVHNVAEQKSALKSR